MRTPQIVLSPIGQSFPYLSVPGSDQIHGVLIDNPSGAWLLLRPSNDYIPPYTLGWARNFAGGIASVSITYESPAGQISTLEGDPAVVVLDTDQVPDSAGSSTGGAFITQFTPTLAFVTNPHRVCHLSTGESFDLITATATQRIRLHYLSGKVDINNLDVHNLSPLEVFFQQDAAGGGDAKAIFTAILSWPHSQVREVVFNPAYDLPIGYKVVVVSRTVWADQHYECTAHYQLI